MKNRFLRFALVAAVALAIPAAAVLANGPSDKAKSHANPHANLSTKTNRGGSENAAERPHNHGWFVSQVAKDHSTTGRAHGEAVSKVARGDDGKPNAAP